MAIQSLEALVGDFLEDDDLVCLNAVVEDRGLYHCALYIGGTDFDLAFRVEQKNLVKLYITVFGLGKTLNENLVSGFHLELLACNFYDCVHF